MRKVQGIAASRGIAIAKAYLLTSPILSYTKTTINNVDTEISRLNKALETTRSQLERIRQQTEEKIDKEHADIFTAHILLLHDNEYIQPIIEKIKTEKINAEAAVFETTSRFIDIFNQIEDDYLRERALDIQDISKRLLANLLGIAIYDLANIDEDVVVIANDLTPSVTAQLDEKYVKGFVTNVGGQTSHTSLIARSLEIPAIVGTKEITSIVATNDLLIVDGLEGKVIVNPTEDELAKYREKQAEFLEKKKTYIKLRNKTTETVDEKQVILTANIGTPDDVERVLKNGGEGIGLFRTEFLYMNNNQIPSEDQQFEAYRSVLEQMEDKPVVVRTLDIGGDKELSYLPFVKEMNPFLGVRGIRFCLEHPDVFRPQLRALLRASIYGNLKIMFPMVTTIEELRAAKKILAEEKDSLIKSGIDVAENIEIGMMIEVPATALMAKQFAKEVDFFSIGTNDLTQYIMAADRMNEHISHLYQPYHPAILNIINHVIEVAHEEGKSVGMCGEMAGDPLAIPILLGLGLDEFSMNASSILVARSQIRKLSYKQITAYKNDILTMTTSDEVAHFIQENLAESKFV